MENVKYYLHHCILTLVQSSVVEGYHNYIVFKLISTRIHFVKFLSHGLHRRVLQNARKASLKTVVAYCLRSVSVYI